MNLDRLSLQDKIYNPVLKDYTKGFIDKSLVNYETEEVEILSGMEYRPDIVAEYYLGSHELAWLVTYINGFQNGISDYVVGRKVKIPKL